MHTLFDKYGGTETMRGLVREFYKYARASPKVGHFFDKLNMERLIDHQVQFLSFILGRPARTYKGRELADAHQPLNISDEDFNEIGRLLKKTLTSAGVADEDVSLIMGVVLGVRDEIVNHHKPTPPVSSAPATNPISEKAQLTSAVKTEIIQKQRHLYLSAYAKKLSHSFRVDTSTLCALMTSTPSPISVTSRWSTLLWGIFANISPPLESL